jgi:hypothetical protein
LVSLHHTTAAKLHSADRAARPAAYNSLLFHSHDPLKCPPSAPAVTPTQTFVTPTRTPSFSPIS